MGGGSDSAADQSNDLIQEQIDNQKAEEARKLKGLYSDELVSLKSGGKMVYQTPQNNKPPPSVDPFTHQQQVNGMKPF